MIRQILKSKPLGYWLGDILGAISVFAIGVLCFIMMVLMFGGG